MNEKKYELVEKIYFQDLKKDLWRIRALRNFGSIKAGDIGGWIESESNLSHYGNSWVANDACVSDGARVYNDALVSDCALVYGNAHICENAHICGNARVYENAYIAGNAEITWHTCIGDGTYIK